MNRQHLDLDRAIDRIAERLTYVDEDAQLASRIVAALPDRVTWFGWLIGCWAPRLAMLAIAAGASLLWSTRQATEVSPVAQPLASVANVHWPQLVASIALEREQRSTPEPEPYRTKPLEPLELLEPLEPFEDLPSVAAPKALMVRDITPEPIPVEGALAVSSLVIDDLPLTAESFPQHD